MSRKSEIKKFLKESGLFLLDILYNALIIIALVIIIRNFLISPFRVIGSSMADTLQSNEFILIDKLSYRLSEPKRGDPIVFKPPITNKYGDKFDESITTDEYGRGVLSLEGLKTQKNVIYCQNEFVAKLWFCQDELKEGDMLFYLPADGSQPGDWNNATERKVAADEARHKELVIKGDPGKTYWLRIYDTSGPEYFVKRIIGIPGDTVKIENGRVYIKKSGGADFEEVKEDYLNAENKFHTYLNQNDFGSEFKVPEEHYFVLGDNRNHSNDSRSWFAPVTNEPTPFVPLKNISGKVLVVLWPADAIRIIKSPASDN
jgi:signal peptidase I